MNVFSFITRYFSKEDAFYKDNFDGHYKYIKSIIPIPSFVRTLLGLPEPKLDRRKRRFGRIRANPLYYITIPMVFVFLLVIVTFVGAFEVLVVYFNTNIYLNGLIISLMIFGILKSFHNCFKLYGTAVFLRKIEKVMYSAIVLPEDIDMLRRSLEKQGELVNTIYMSQTIDNIEKFGHPNFNDMRSRLIKSKLGRRCSRNRADVNFIAGILVMLGLLGTFLGLLGTIDAVGEAMNSMSNIGGESGEIGMEEMTGFIGSLAAPLQGMGLAFSSSLFGLSGSLLIGFFLHLAGTPQNEFIENVSRWIDDREQKFDPNIAKNSKARIPPKDSDLKDWLSGFIHMSVRTNEKISKLTENVSLATDETTRAWNEVQGLSVAQTMLNNTTQAMSEHLGEMRQTSQTVADSMPQIINSVNSSQGHIADKIEAIKQDSIPHIIDSISSSQGHIADKIEAIKQDSNSLSSNILDNNKLMRHYMAFSKKENELNKAVVTDIKNLIVQSNLILNDVVELNKNNLDQESLEIIKETLIHLNQGQTEVLLETKELLKRLQQDPQMAQAHSLVEQLNDLLKDLNKKTKSLFSSKEK